jgi:hypothetical protein
MAVSISLSFARILLIASCHSAQNPISTFYDGPVDSIDITGDFNAFEAAYPGENAVRVVRWSQSNHVLACIYLSRHQTLKFVPDPI